MGDNEGTWQQPRLDNFETANPDVSPQVQFSHKITESTPEADELAKLQREIDDLRATVAEMETLADRGNLPSGAEGQLEKHRINLKSLEEKYFAALDIETVLPEQFIDYFEYFWEVMKRVETPDEYKRRFAKLVDMLENNPNYRARLEENEAYQTYKDGFI